MKNREDIVISMCLTARHDFGLVWNGPYPFPSGMTNLHIVFTIFQQYPITKAMYIGLLVVL